MARLRGGKLLTVADRFRRFAACITGCLLVYISPAQSLLGNPGFEDRNTCTEFNIQCAPEAWFFLPRYSRMSPVDADSNHFEIITMGNPRADYSVGNFIYTKMFCMLQPKAKYRLSFRIRIPTFAFDYLDIWLSSGEPGSRRNSIYSARPSFSIPVDSIWGDPKQWMKVNYTFTARGGERFFMMGNIQQQPLVKARRSSRKKRAVEYWIDDITLYPVDTSMKTCTEYEAIRDQVYRNDPRHPGKFVELIPIDSSLIVMPPRPDSTGKRDTVVIPAPVVVKPPKPDTLIIPDVLFHFNSSRLNPKFRARLDTLGRKIQSIRFSRLLIEGHTDNAGGDQYNLELSAARAETIRTYLAETFHIDKRRIDATGYGESRPRATNVTAAGRQQNRRVEIIIYYQ
ncbi:MAG TPA: OmpA family protein [Chitinophagaceae bacterium]